MHLVADQLTMAIQQAVQQSQEGACAAAGGSGDFGRKRPGVEMSDTPAKRPRPGQQDYTPFPGRNLQRTEGNFEEEDDSYMGDEEDFSGLVQAF